MEVPEGAPPGTVLQPVGNGKVAGLQVPEGAAAGTVLQFQVEIDDGEGGEDLSDQALRTQVERKSTASGNPVAGTVPGEAPESVAPPRADTPVPHALLS